MTEIDKVLETSPDYDVALYYKALCYLGAEDGDKDLEAFDTFIQKCPNSIYYTVAVALSGADTTSEKTYDVSITTEVRSKKTTKSVTHSLKVSTFDAPAKSSSLHTSVMVLFPPIYVAAGSS